MGSSPGFGSTPCDYACLCSKSRPIQTRFRCGSACHWLNLATKSNSPAHSPRGPPSDLLQRSIVLRLLVSIRFQVLFTPLTGVLFTFPSRYLFTIGHQQYLALEDGPPCFPQDSTCPVVLKNTSRDFPFSPTGLSPSTVALSRSI